jgi:hypothetical protein
MKDGVVSLVGSKDIVHEFPYIVIEYFKDGIHRPSDAELNIEGQAVVAERIQQFYETRHTINGHIELETNDNRLFAKLFKKRSSCRCHQNI